MNFKLISIVIATVTLFGCQVAATSGDPLKKVRAGGAAVCGDTEIQQVALDFAKEKIFQALDAAPSSFGIVFHLDGGQGPPPYNDRTAIRAVKAQIRLLGFDPEIGQTKCSLPLEFDLHDGSVGRSEMTFWTQVNAGQDDWIVGLEGLTSVHDLLVADRDRFLYQAAMNKNSASNRPQRLNTPDDEERGSVNDRAAPAQPADPLPSIRAGQLYSTVRADLIRRGFRPLPQERTEWEYFCGSDRPDEGDPDLCVVYSEVESCAGSGLRPCTFVFERQTDGRRLNVSTTGETFERIAVQSVAWHL